MYKLREIEEKDLLIINKWRNNPELISLLGAPYRFINLMVDKDWFDSYMHNRDRQVRCAVVTEESDDILGLVSLTNIDYLNQSAELHIMIGDSVNQGKGIGTFAVQKILGHAFNNLNLHRVELTVLETNERAKNLYTKCGFIKEGTMRKCIYKQGNYVSLELYSILKDEYRGGV